MEKYVRIAQGIELSKQIMGKTGLKIKILHMAKGGHIKIVGAKVQSVEVSTAKDPKGCWDEYPHTATAIAFPHFGYQKVIVRKKRKAYELYFFKVIDDDLKFIGTDEEEAVAWLMVRLLTKEMDWDACERYYFNYYCNDDCQPRYHPIFDKWIAVHWKTDEEEAESDYQAEEWLRQEGWRISESFESEDEFVLVPIDEYANRFMGEAGQ